MRRRKQEKQEQSRLDLEKLKPTRLFFPETIIGKSLTTSTIRLPLDENLFFVTTIGTGSSDDFFKSEKIVVESYFVSKVTLEHEVLESAVLEGTYTKVFSTDRVEISSTRNDLIFGSSEGMYNFYSKERPYRTVLTFDSLEEISGLEIESKFDILVRATDDITVIEWPDKKFDESSVSICVYEGYALLRWPDLDNDINTNRNRMIVRISENPRYSYKRISIIRKLNIFRT